MFQLSHPYLNTGKTIVLTIQMFVGKVMSLLYNMLSRFVIAFLPRSKHLLISWLQSPSTVIFELILHCFIIVSGGILTIQFLSLSCHGTLKCRGVGRVYFPKPIDVGAGLVTCSGQQDVGRSDSVLVQARALWSCEPLREEPVPCDPRTMWRHIEQNWNQKCWLLAQEIQSMKQSHPTWPANTGQKEKHAAASHWILCCLSSLILTTNTNNTVQLIWLKI